MLSKVVVSWFSHTIWLASRFYAIPSNWNPTTQRFESQKLNHKVIGDHIVKVIDTVCRIWCIIAYGWIGYNYSKHKSTIVQVLFPISFVCCVNWCWNVKYVSHAYRTEFEQFVNGFVNLNAYLAKELTVEDKNMPHQKLLKTLLSSSGVIAMLFSLTGACLWQINYLNLNAYVYWFGMTPGRFLYPSCMGFWIFWNYLLSIYVLALTLYFTSIHDWLKYIGHKFGKEEFGLNEFLHYYKCIQITNILFSRALGAFFLPVGFFLSQVTVVVIAGFTILSYAQISLFPIYLICSMVGIHIFFLVTVTRMSSQITARSQLIISNLKRYKLDKWKILYKRRKLNQIREIRIYIGSFYFIDPGTLLVTLDIVLENLISLLLAYK